MEANVSSVLAIGLALCFLGIPVVALLCLRALRLGAEFEAELTPTSFRLKTKPAALPREDDDDNSAGGSVHEGGPVNSSKLRPDRSHKTQD